MTRRRLVTLSIAVVTAVVVASVVLADGSSGNGVPGAVVRNSSGSIDQTNQMWVCKGPVDLDSVKVTMTSDASALPRTGQDAIHLSKGCTGRIGQLQVVQYAADGVKVEEGVHDLTVGGGSIRCFAKSPGLHQDGIQVMGGSNITFENMSIDCGRPNESLINSNLFVNEAPIYTSPPTDIVCDHCSLGGGASHTASIQTSVRSGLRDSTICLGKFPKLSLSIGPRAVDPVNSGNELVDCATGATTTTPVNPAGPTQPKQPRSRARITIAAAKTVVDFGQPLVLSGTIASGKEGRRVAVFAQAFDAAGPTRIATTMTDVTGTWQVTVKPGVLTTYTALAVPDTSTPLRVEVRPHVLLGYGAGRLTARVLARRSFAERPIYVQRFDGARWRTVKRLVLGPRSGAIFPFTSRGARLRVSLPAMPGYLGATSDPVVVK